METAAIHGQSRAEARRIPAWLCPALLAAVLSGCVSDPSPDQMSRTTLDTAPADLQLLCASEAARSAGIDGTKVLPTSSRRLDARSFQVELNVGGAPTRCTIDSDGRIASIRPA